MLTPVYEVKVGSFVQKTTLLISGSIGDNGQHDGPQGDGFPS